MGTRNIDKDAFDLTIYFKPPSGDPQETIPGPSGQPISYLQVFALDRRDLTGNLVPDNLLDDDPNIINWSRGELIFPDLEPFNSQRLGELDPNKLVPAIYDTTDRQFITSKSNFYVSTSAKVRETSYSLGFNVIENSEKIILNGEELTSGVGYNIDYFTGNLTLLDERALFNNSFIGGTFLYLNQSTLDQKIRIGQSGPMQNLVWNLNTALNFESDLITKGLNALPFVQAKEPSRIRFEAELAEIIPNPNSRNNPATGDANGVVYIDDFESAKRESPLGIIRRQWTVSGVPKIIPGWAEYNLFPNDVFKNQSRGRLIWYNPDEQVAIRQIWPEQDVNPTVPQRVHVLTLRLTRKEEFMERTWAGLMRFLSPGYADQSTSKFLEVWVQGNEGEGGRLHFDFGQISEDAIPNGQLDTEDHQQNFIRNGILDEGEDTGLDGVAGQDGLNVPGDDGDDDYFHQLGSNDYERINGTEANQNDEGGRFPDTEDLNNNGSVDLRNDYFSFSFSLDRSHPDTALIAGGEGLNPADDFGWRMYRIPLAKPDTTVGNPQWTNIEYVRLWLDQPQKDNMHVSIAKVNLVGSEWKERGVITAGQIDANRDSTVQIATVNTFDNPDYEPPPGVAGERDQVTRVVRREQALVLKVTDLAPGEMGLVEKTFFQSQSYVNYSNMKMFIYGSDPFGFHINNDTSFVEIAFRFGADQSNYYEFREKVFPGWAPRNEMILDFMELTGLKNRTSEEFKDRDGNLFVQTADGDTLRVVGKPSLTNVRQLTVGIVNRHATEFFSGQIWINELRLSDVRKDKGKALRARIDAKLSDVVNVNADLNSVDDDFRTLNERFGKGSNRLGGSVNASLQMDRFLPKALGLAIPVTVGYQESESSPKYFPGSDIIVSEKTANDSLLEAIKTRSSKTSFSLGLRRNSRSKNFITKYTLDALSVNYSYSETFSSNSIVENARSFSYSGNVTYNLNINSKAHINPFGWLGNGPIVRPLSSTSFFFLPTRLNYKIAFNRRKQSTLNRNGLFTPKYTFVINQNGGIAFKPFNSLSLDISRSHVNDLREVLDFKEVFGGKMGPLTSVNQSIKGQYNPSLSNWFKVNFSLNTNFRYNNNITQKTLGKSASNQVNYAASTTFTPKMLVQKFSRRQPARRPPARAVPPKQEQDEEEEKDKTEKDKQVTDEEEEDKRGFPVPNPLKLFGFIGSKLQPIALRYSKNFTSNNFALEGIPSFAFQIGRTFDPGPVISQNVGSNRGSLNEGYKIDASSGLELSSQIRFSLKYAYDNVQTKTTVTTGSISDTRWRIGESEIPFPDWTLRWSGLEKLKLIKPFIQRLSLEHGRNSRLVSKWQDRPDSVTTETLSSNFRPLLGINITWKGNLTSTIQMNRGLSETVTRRGGLAATRKKSSNLTASVSYSKSGGLKIPLPFFKNKVVKNKIDFALNFTKSLDVTEQRKGEQGDFQEWTRNEKWSLTPRLTYSFSTTVRGGLHFEFGKTKNKLLGETKITEFGINVNIQIAGR
jgi:hypothetical protein